MTEAGERTRKNLIMVVDDEDDILEVVGKMLKYEGYDVETACSGEECLGKLEEGIRPSLILLDIMMEGMDGWEVLRRIKADRRFDDILFSMLTVKPLTTDTLQEQKIDYIENYIVKPFKMKDLLSQVAEMLGMEEHLKKVVAKLLSMNLKETAEQYEIFARKVARHSKLIRELKKSAATGSEEKRDKLKRVLELEDKLVALNRQRLDAIKERYGISSGEQTE